MYYNCIYKYNIHFIYNILARVASLIWLLSSPPAESAKCFLFLCESQEYMYLQVWAWGDGMGTNPVACCGVTWCSETYETWSILTGKYRWYTFMNNCVSVSFLCCRIIIFIYLKHFLRPRRNRTKWLCA